MNYENLLEFLSDGEIKVGEKNPVNADMALKFFKRYRLAFTAVNVLNEVVCEHIPEKRNKDFAPAHFYCLIHNEHIYVLNHETKGIKANTDLFKVSTNYSLVEKEKFDATVETYDQLLALKIETASTTRVLFTGDLNNLLFYLKEKCQYEPKCQIIDGNCKTISLKINQSRVIVKSATSNNEEALLIQGGNDDNSKELCLKYIDEQRRLKSVLLSRYYLSHYDEAFHFNMINHKIGPIAGTLQDGKVKYAIDFSLAYSSILRELPFIPATNHFDNFEVYDGAPIVDQYLYNVRFYGESVSERLYSEKSERYTYGYNLKHYNGKYEILLVCKISRAPRNLTKCVMDSLWESDLDTQDKKNIMNMAIGCLGKLKQTHHETFLFSTADEANAMMQPGDSVSVITNNVLVPVADDLLDGGITYKNQPTSKMFYVNKSIEGYTVNGFYPVQVLIWDTMRRKLYQLAESLKKQNVNVIAVKTDCLFVDKKVETVDGFNVIPKGERKFGCITICKQDIKLPTKRIEFEEVESFFDLRSPASFKEHGLNDEFDDKQWDKFLDAHQSVLIKGILPGSGKTTNVMNYCKRKNLKACIIAPCNDLAKTHAMTFGVDAFTVDTFFGMLFFKDGGGRKSIDASEYEVVVFDEIYSYTTDRLKRVQAFINKNENKKIIATGDFLQNEPIESLDVESHQYYDNIMSSMFSHHLWLTNSRRLLNKNEINIVLNMKKFIFDKFDTMPREEFIKKFCNKFSIPLIDELTYKKGTVNQCYLNESCAAVNRFYNKNESNGKTSFAGSYNWFVGMQVVNKVRFVLKPKIVFDINSRYTIKSVNGVDVVLTSMFGEKVEVPYAVFNKNFRPTHSSTGHSVQGKTFTDNIEIFDVMHPFITAKWFWTAITRCRALRQLTINLYNTKKLDISSYNLASVIYNHNESDENNDRVVVRPLTVEWVERQLSMQKGHCYLCENVLNLAHIPGDPLNISIDRMDNMLGHCQKNCKLSCARCNCTKK